MSGMSDGLHCRRGGHKRLGLALFGLGAVALSGQTTGTELWFPPSLMTGDPQGIADLSHFEKGGQLPGMYQVEIWLNDSLISTRQLSFIEPQNRSDLKGVLDTTGLMACLTHEDLAEWGVRPDALTAAVISADGGCLSPAQLIPQASTRFDFQKMRLNVSIPQAFLLSHPRGWISPEQWDEGITAGLLNYNFSGSDNRGQYSNSSNHYLQLNSGLNAGPWRLRDSRTWTKYDSARYSYRKWQHNSTYVERAVIPLRSRLTLGDATTGGDVFDSLGFRGVRLMTDDRMYPDSQRGYAPVIRGTAMSNARVSVRQNGYVVYQTNVVPGDFVIDDLFPMYTSGDMEVTVAEADGSTRAFTVPYSSVPLLLREGRMKYALTAGKLRSSSDRYETPAFVESTLTWGLPHGVTTYGGVQYADNYRAGVLGAGINMGVWGAVSADITHANSVLTDDSKHEGQSVRFLYGRSLNELGTTFQLTGYRYSTQGFYSLDETALKGMSGWLYNSDTVDSEGNPIPRPVTDYYNLYDNKRQRLQANISQRIMDMGSLYLTGSRQTYWNRSGTSESLQAGFSSSLGPVNYSLSFSQNRTAGLARTDQTVFMSLSLPLDRWLPSGSPKVFATMSGNRDNNGNLTQQGGLSGTLLEERNLNWSVNQGYSRTNGDSGNASLGYQGTYGNGNLGYSHSSHYRQTSYGVSGGAILHRNGLTLGQPLGDTSVLIAAPGAAGVPLENGTGVKTDWRGYTIRPFATSYRENRVVLDTSKLDDRTEIDSGVSRVVPTRGAVVRADFKTRSGLRALFTLTRNGNPLPFGTIVSAGNNSGIVGDDGQVFLSGLEAEGALKAQWGADADQRCTVKYRIPEAALKMSLIQTDEVCR